MTAADIVVAESVFAMVAGVIVDWTSVPAAESGGPCTNHHGGFTGALIVTGLSTNGIEVLGNR